MRAYDGTAKQWSQVILDVYRGRFANATATWKDGEMTIRSDGTDQEGKPVVSRTRFHAISPNAFKYQTDRSGDGGATWDTAVLRIDARRVAPAAPR